MEIWHDLLLFIGGNLEKSPDGYLIFLIASAIFGCFAFIVSLCLLVIKNKSNLSLSKKDILMGPLLLMAYTIGAAIVGLIGLIVNILNFHAMGAVSAGFGWPYILNKIYAMIKEPEQPEQKEEEEK